MGIYLQLISLPSSNPKFQPFFIVVIFLRGCVPDVIEPAYAVDFINIPRKLGFGDSKIWFDSICFLHRKQ